MGKYPKTNNDKSKNPSKSLLVVGNLAKDVIFGVEHFGGCAATISLTLSWLGFEVDVLSVVGKDNFSEKFVDHLNRHGVGVKYIYRDIENIPICEVTSSENSNSRSNWIDNGCHDAMDNMDESHLPDHDYDTVHLVSSPPKLSRLIADNFSDISYEPGPLLLSNHRYFDPYVAEKTNLVFLNEEEYEAVLDYQKGISPKGYDFSFDVVIVTLGKKGSKLIKQNGSEVFIPVDPVEEDFQNPGGAGDNYTAGFLFGYLYGFSFENSAKFGSRLGSECVKQKNGILPKERVETIYQKNRLL